MITLHLLIQDIQRQIGNIRGQIALQFDLIGEALKDLKEIEKRLNKLFSSHEILCTSVVYIIALEEYLLKLFPINFYFLVGNKLSTRIFIFHNCEV